MHQLRISAYDLCIIDALALSALPDDGTGLDYSSRSTDTYG